MVSGGGKFNPGLHPRDSHGRFRMTLQEAKDFISGHYGDWHNSLTPSQDKGLRFYQSAGFPLMNGQLRGLDPEELKKAVHASDADLVRAKSATKAFASAIKKAPPLKAPLTVSRGFSADQFGKLTPGQTIQDKAFVSVSLTDDAGAIGKVERHASAEITLPAGTRAGAGYGRELMLPPGAKFRINKVTTKNGEPHVLMEYIIPS